MQEIEQQAPEKLFTEDVRRWYQQLGRSRSSKKTAAVQANGRKGGRPRKDAAK